MDDEVNPLTIEGPAPRLDEWSEVGPRSNLGPLPAGGWRISEKGQLQIHCRCGTDFFASEETGMGNGSVGYCYGCGKHILASGFFRRWKAGITDRPIPWG